MLKLFRKIREKLMEHPPTGRTGNNVRKYLLYAIGEILLVLIGIFIAQQINNWNEEQIGRDPEQIYLQNLIYDFECHLFELGRQK